MKHLRSLFPSVLRQSRRKKQRRPKRRPPEPTIEATAEETVETQAAEESQSAVTAEEPQVTEAPQESDPYGGQLVWISETGSKYHNKNNCGRMNPDRAYQMTRENAETQGYEPCKKCF